ncbi:MAG: FAD-dependent oxidoreductase [Bdellovibrionota bacterium]|nr:MAG: FAD-dependent oxidoreductase [Bdellovibrionota bacterium]
MKALAVVGGGVSGIVAAYYLSRRYSVTLIEGDQRLGGHTNTREVRDSQGRSLRVDTGFIVCNNRTYPLFHRFLSELGIPVRDADMSFGFYDRASGFEYSGATLCGLFPSLGDALSLPRWRFFLNVLRFNRRALIDLESGALTGLTLSEYLGARGVSEQVAQDYILPLSAAIWSASVATMANTPAESVLRFFKNHGLLELWKRPQWQTVVGGSQAYVQRFKDLFSGTLRIGERVRSVRREAGQVHIELEDGSQHRYDGVVLATHADITRSLLADPDPVEAELLEPWSYEDNVTVLHTDTSFLPPSNRVWASWNYQRDGTGDGSRISVTYHMNRLQGLTTPDQYLVTLNPSRPIPQEKVLYQTTYSHPHYTLASLGAQKELHRLQGRRNTYFCGSYFGYGFHEDAVRSAVEVARLLGCEEVV